MGSNLHKPLSELNDWLETEDIYIELIIIGAFAIHLHGLSNRMTMDIDTIKPIEDHNVLKQIEVIARKYGLPRWLNDQAENLIMPEGFESRINNDNRYSNIKLNYISRIDLIYLKVAAFFYRGSTDPKDKDDIKSLATTQKELEDAIKFLRERHTPEIDKFKLDFENRVQEISLELSNAIR